MSECCNECDYWEDRIDMYIDNQIKEAKLAKIAKKDLKDKVYRVGNVKVIAKVGTTSSHK